jgi:hypothetical protein
MTSALCGVTLEYQAAAPHAEACLSRTLDVTVFWQPGTARLLPRLRDRKSGPVFITRGRRESSCPRPTLTPCGRSRLSYQAAALCRGLLFTANGGKAHSGGRRAARYPSGRPYAAPPAWAPNVLIGTGDPLAGRGQEAAI